RGREEPGRLARASERAFDRVLAGYERTLGGVLRHQRLTLAVTLGTMAATLFLYVVIPKGFFPQQDSGRLVGTILADQDTSFQSFEKKLPQFEGILMADPAIESATGILGGAANTGRMFVGLKPRDQRDVTADQII